MKHRKWLIFSALACILYALVFPRYLPFWTNFGDTDVWAPVYLAITCLVCWTALEVVAGVFARRPLKCHCGYSLEGVRCPECGESVGKPRN